MMPHSRERVWAIIGRISVVIGSLVGLVTLWNWWHTPAPHVQATVSYGPWYAPPVLQEVVDRIHSLGEPAAIDELLVGSRADSGDQVSDEQTKIANTISDAIREWFDYATLQGLTRPAGYWRVIVVNRGDVTATDVAIRIPEATAIQVFSDSEPARTIGDGSTAVLDSLRPSEEVLVVGWSVIEPSIHGLEGLTVSHAAGRAKIKVAEAREWMSYKLEHGALRLAMVLAVLLVAAKTMEFLTARRKRRGRKPDDQEPEAEAR